jgi:SAM-dependent methyltransferase
MLAAERPTLLAAAVSLVMLFTVAVALHSRLYETRPEPARLTQFYLVMSAGGALGGLFTALVAPLLFDWSWEHPLLIVAAAALLPLGRWAGLLEQRFASRATLGLALAALLLLLLTGSIWLRRQFDANPGWGAIDLIALALLVAAALVLAARRWAFVLASVVLLATLGGITQLMVTLQEGARTRSYFGIYTVSDSPTRERTLMHGTTLHGMQSLDPKRALEPTTYYGPTGGGGLTMLAAEKLFGDDARIAVVGLGVGTLACYRRPGQAWVFYEIDPEVLAYSKRGQFTFLDRCAPGVPVVIGDARLKLAGAQPGSFDILAVDAFSSDAIPLHLLTDEAATVYFRALAPDGLLLIHISNRFVDLETVLSALARERGLAAALRDDNDYPALRARQLMRSRWVVLSRDRIKLAALTASGGWKPLGPPAASVWHDDFASILPYLTWKSFF